MNIEPFCAAFRRCFPDEKSPDLAAYVSLLIFMTSGSSNSSNIAMWVGDQRDEEKHLSSVVHHLNAALAAYRQLHPLVRRGLDSQFGLNSKERRRHKPIWAKAGEVYDEGSFVYLDRILIDILYSLTGKLDDLSTPARGEGLLDPMDAWHTITGKSDHSDYFARLDQLPDALLELREICKEVSEVYWRVDAEELPSAIASAAKRASELVPETGKARAEETWQKAVLVDWAIRCWRKYGQAEPDLGSAEFKDLLQGLLYTFDPDSQRNWDAGDLVRSYRRSIRKVELPDHK